MIHARGLVQTFHTRQGRVKNEVRAVDGVDLDVAEGEIVAFLGPNGAGKTTTIDMVLGLSRPDAGTAEVFGMSPRSAVAHGLVTAVMQTGGLLKDLTVDFDTLEDDAVTVRERDSMSQERIGLDAVEGYLKQRLPVC